MNNNVSDIVKMLREMRLPVIAEQLQVLVESNELTKLSALEALEQLIESEYHSRKNNTINRLKKNSKISQKNANILDIDYRPDRNINRSIVEQLLTNDYILKHRNVIILGACGTGKSFIANALGNHACDNSHSTFYRRIFEFIDECNQEKMLTGTVSKAIKKYAKYDVFMSSEKYPTVAIEKRTTYVKSRYHYFYDNGFSN